MSKRLLFVFLSICSVAINAQINVKAMFYNVLNYDSDTQSETRTPYLKNILDEVQPDLFMICELKGENASNYLFDNAVKPHNPNFSKAPFRNTLSPANNLQQMVYYNSNKLILEVTDVITTGVRDINQYTFRLNTEDADVNPIKIEVFVTHLKASRGTSNRQKRLEAVDTFVERLNLIPSDSYVLFAGDFNFYTSNEEGFLKLIDNNNPIKIIDPIDRLCPPFPNNGLDYFNEDYDATYFWNNSSFADVHSQSTRSSSLADGAGGGMDDRFDFIMMSENFNSSSNLNYKQNSYKTIGNNGNCYNGSVNDTNCTGSYSLALRNSLYLFSDHLPIVMDLEAATSTLSVANINPIIFTNSNLVTSTLRFTTTNKNIKKLIIYNQLGQKVVDLRTNNKTEFSIDFNEFSKGIYYLKADNFSPSKIIKI
mgnify:CR=1 FL=1